MQPPLLDTETSDEPLLERLIIACASDPQPQPKMLM